MPVSGPARPAAGSRGRRRSKHEHPARDSARRVALERAGPVLFVMSLDCGPALARLRAQVGHDPTTPGAPLISTALCRPDGAGRQGYLTADAGLEPAIIHLLERAGYEVAL